MPAVTLDLEGTDGDGNAQLQTLDGSGDQRGLFIYSGVVNVTDLTLSDMRALGGSGASGGGGGAGLGGGLFVAGAPRRVAPARRVIRDKRSFQSSRWTM